jgi:hypothetical protein
LSISIELAGGGDRRPADLVLFRRLLSASPMMAMIGSLALSILSQAVLQLGFGSQPRHLPVPLEQGLSSDGTLVTPSQIWLVPISVTMLVLLLGLLSGLWASGESYRIHQLSTVGGHVKGPLAGLLTEAMGCAGLFDEPLAGEVDTLDSFDPGAS